MSERRSDLPPGAVAVVGLAGRFPGARNPGELWRNLRAGVESIRRLSDEELLAAGVERAALADPAYVKAAACPEGIEGFDARFFGFSPSEAEILDPQQRLLLELAWEVLEDAGQDPAAIDGAVGVFAGATLSTYLTFHLLPNRALRARVDPLALLVANTADTLATRVSYKLDLHGPSFGIAAACSSSLVAVHAACQSLLADECDLALAGGVSLNLAHRWGYRYQPQSILSPDGHCRAFDAAAAGTVFGSGGGLVALKRLEDALADGDPIRALIRGSAVNNDGSSKVGYTAPSVDGQAEVIAEALAVSGVGAETLGYLEAHGTGTRLGDPVEVAALTRAFRADTDARGFCALGTIKPNLGHLDVAAGVAGLIKTVLALEAAELPPAASFTAPNPEIDFAASPVYVNTELKAWEAPADGTPRRAGVSSFGFGGTNAHVVLEEAPAREAPAASSRAWQPLVISARTPEALAAAGERLVAHLEAHPDEALADVAWTLAVGRRAFPQRRVVAARDRAEALAALGRAGALPGIEGVDDELAAAARRWLAGEEVAWGELWTGEARRRLPLPTYPFERQRYWIDAPGAPAPGAVEEETGAAVASVPAAPRHPRPPLPVAYREPEGELERGVAAIWEELLALAPVGADDDFFELGGHSLLGTQVVSRLQRAYGVELPLAALFEAPTPARLAALVGELDAGETRREGPPIPARDPGAGAPPLSFAQQRLWFIDRLEPGNPLYNEPRAVRIEGDLGRRGVALLEAALTAVAARHEVLRTTFVESVTPGEAGEPFQVISAAARAALPLVDLAGLPTAARRPLAARLAVAEGRRGFDLERGPVWRTTLLRLAAGEHLALLTLHHIASDGWSMGVLVHELAALYPALAAGEAPALPALPVQYADYAVWQRAWLAGDTLAKLLAYWREELAGLPPALELPTDRPRPPLQSVDGAHLPLALPAGLTAAARELARGSGATLFMVLAAGFAALLARWSGQGDLALGTPVANRGRPEIEGLIGFFVNTLVLRARPAAAASFGELVAAVRATALGAFAHQELPFERLVEELSPERDLARTPLFSVLFALQNVPTERLELPGLSLAPEPVHNATAKFDLSLSLSEEGEGLSGAFEYAAALFDPSTVERLGRHLVNLLAAALAAPEAPLDALPLLTAAERHQLLEAGRAAAPAVEAPLFPAAFAAVVRRTPEREALAWEAPEVGVEVLTYGALAGRAAALAGRLTAAGAGPETRVAVYLERSPAMLVAVLGALAAGGAYVPLDPAHPAERLAAILADSGAAVLVAAAGGELPPLPEPAPHLLRLAPEGAVAEGPPAPPARSRHPLGGQLAYVLFTSGSTGRPKGVAISHRALAAFLAAMAERPGLGAEDRVLALTTLSFDISILELLLPLARGARIELAGRREAVDGEALSRRLERSRASVLQATPATWRLLLASSPAGGAIGEGGLAALSGGEALPGTLARELLGRLGGGRLWNLYGPTETTVWSAVAAVDEAAAAGPVVALGEPVAGTVLVVADRRGEPVPLEVAGELSIGGAGLARGYLGRPGLTAERFVPDPFSGVPGSRLYRTGDLVRRRRGGRLEFLGRIDHQVKLRGFRIELGEVEAALAAHPAVAAARAVVRRPAGDPEAARLVAYWSAAGDDPPADRELLASLRRRLPEYMVPGALVRLAALPLTPSGKVDVNALPPPAERRAVVEAEAVPRGRIESAVAAVWCEVLGVERVGLEESFFDLGGHSLLLPRALARLRATLPGPRARALTLIDLFRLPTVAALAGHLGSAGEESASVARGRERALARRRALNRDDPRIAIIGLAGRFPGARDAGELWRNLRAGVESIRRLSDEELLAQGVPAETLADPSFVPVAAAPDGIELFDARFFGFSAREAELLDPQQRWLLESAWEALEDAGYDPRAGDLDVGVFAGAATSTYLLYNLANNPALAGVADPLQVLFANAADSVATRLSYKLDLRGPSFTLATACSTSLLAVHQACESLLGGACDLALAGGVAIPVGHLSGYRHQPESILSPDGHCRAFDAEAAGTVFGGGVGLVVLKRLADALADGDTIRAVVCGSAVNNDGAAKVGYTAPSVDGQAEVIAEALAFAGVEAGSIGYLEAHGTGTRLGDPIEVAALTQAFRADTDRQGFCALGTVKSNLGHLDVAAGVAGLAKTVLALEAAEIPPTLHFANPNPEIDFATGPLYVNTELRDWPPPPDGAPRRAGVSSFGFGGTNVHVVLEEAPARPAPAPTARTWQPLVLAARTAEALAAAGERLAGHLDAHPGAGATGGALADVGWTLAVGRRAFAHRRVVVARDRAEALAALRGAAAPSASGGTSGLSWAGEVPQGGRELIFLFPGQGSQYHGMGRGLYEAESVFRREIDRCAQLLGQRLGRDLREVLWGTAGGDAGELVATEEVQPALYAVEYALACQWRSWGVEPAAMIGHSVGEYVAATLAGVLELEDALALVAERGRLMGELPAGGAMLSVELGEGEVAAILDELAAPAGMAPLSLAAINAPRRVVVSGDEEGVAALAALLAERGVGHRRLRTSHAFHSPRVAPAAERFRAVVGRVELRPPRRRYLSNVTGGWIRDEEATDPEYWVRHLLGTVRFAAGLETVAGAEGRWLGLEVGPGRALTSLAAAQGVEAVASMRHARQEGEDGARLVGAAARLWLAGAEIAWGRLWEGETRRRVPLPTYPFERRRYWIDPPGSVAPALAPAAAAARAPGAPEQPVEPVELAAPPAPSTVGLHPRPPLPVPYREPGTEQERRVAGIWQQLLGVGPIGADDDFFDLGGHSLLGTQVVARLRAETGVELPLAALFEAPTPARLAASLAAREGVTPAAEEDAPAVSPRRAAGEPLPLSPGQQRIWWLHQLDPGRGAFNLPAAVRLDGRVDPAALRAALARLVERHEVLRSGFVLTAAGLAQEPASPSPPPLPVVDLGALGEAGEEVEARLLGAATARPFDLTAPPLLRALLVRHAAKRHQLLLTTHQIACDGLSLAIVQGDLVELYRAAVAGEAPRLPELGLQLADYADGQRRRWRGERLAAEVEWWRRRLAGLTPLDLAGDRPRPRLPAFRGGHATLPLGPKTGRSLVELAQRCGASPFVATTAAFAALLSRLGDRTAFALGTLSAHRDEPALAGMIGPFVNPLAVPADLAGDPTYVELIERLHASLLAVHEHQEVPFEHVASLAAGVRPPRDPSRPPLFEVMAVPIDGRGLAVELPGLALSAASQPHDLGYHDLVLWVEEGEGLAGWLEYNAELFTSGTAEALAEALAGLIAAAVADPERPLSELLPELPSLAVAKAASPAAVPAEPPAEPTAAEPRTAVEAALVELWRSATGAPRVGVLDDFFGLGGDSLAAARLSATINATFEVDLPLRALVAAPTPAEVALAVEERMIAQLGALSEEELVGLL